MSSVSERGRLRLSTAAVPPPDSVELGLVHGECVVSKSIVGDTFAAVKNLSVGGEIKPYTQLLALGTDRAIERLAARAAALGADGVYGIQFMAPQVAGGAAEVVAVGTAYRLQSPEDPQKDI